MMNRENSPGGAWEDKELDREDDLAADSNREADRPYGRDYGTSRGNQYLRQRYGEGRGRGYEQREYNRQSNNWQTPGPYTGVGPKGYRRSDERIFDEVNERLTRHGQIDAGQVSVGVTHGEVTLNGSVNTRREKYIAEYIAESVSGVREVYNNLRVERGDARRQSWKAPGEAEPTREDESYGIPNTGRANSPFPSSGTGSMSGGQGSQWQTGRDDNVEMGRSYYGGGQVDRGGQTRATPPAEMRGEGMTPPSAEFSSGRDNLRASGEMMHRETDFVKDEEDEPHPTGGPAAVGSGPTNIAAGLSGSTYGDREKDQSQEPTTGGQIPPTGGGVDTYRDQATTQRSLNAAGSGKTDIKSHIWIGMEVLGRGGEKLGEMKEIRETDFLLDRPLARDIYVPLRACDRVEDGRLHLTVDEDSLTQQGWEHPPIL